MKNLKMLSLLVASAMAVTALAACGSTADTAAEQPAESESAVESTEEAVEDAEPTEAPAESAESTDADAENEAAAQQLLVDLTGSYQELWPVILADEYTQTWLDDCAALVGEDNAQAAYDKLSSMVTGTLIGEDAVEAYADGNGVYDCEFQQGVATLEFDGDKSEIKGYDADGNELFDHSYHYVGMEEIRGLYEFATDDADAGEFTYFCIAPDTSATTYHIELRYGSSLEELGQYDAGPYAYWLGSGIATDCDQTMIENCIELFCNENLAG